MYILCNSIVIWKQSTINSIMSQCINKPIQSMDLCNVLLHSSTIKYYITLSDRIYYRILPDIYTTFAPWKHFLLFKFLCLLINVRTRGETIIFFGLYMCTHFCMSWRAPLSE